MLVPDVLTVDAIDREDPSVPTCRALPEPLASPATIVLLPSDHAAENPVPPFWPSRFDPIVYRKVSEKYRSACDGAALPPIQPAQNVLPVAVTAGDKIEGLRQWPSGRCLTVDRAGGYFRKQEGGCENRGRLDGGICRQSATTSPPARVLNAMYMLGSMDPSTARTDPSHSRNWAKP